MLEYKNFNLEHTRLPLTSKTALYAYETLLYYPHKIAERVNLHPNPGYVKKLMSKLLPFNIGLEFDVHNIKHWSKETIKKLGSNCVDFNMDYEVINYDNEIRMQLAGYPQLNALYQLCNEMNKHCICLDKSGGLHVHIHRLNTGSDYHVSEVFREYADSDNSNVRFLGDITGEHHYDYKVSTSKCTSVFAVVRTNPMTIEYRLLTTTFDYQAIVHMLMEFSNLTRDIYITKLNKRYKSDRNTKRIKPRKPLTDKQSNWTIQYH